MDEARSGDLGAWESLVRGFDNVLRGVARSYRLSEYDVADVVQQTWLRCLEHVHEIRDPLCFPSWLMMICRRESLRALRAAGRSLPFDHTEAGSVLAAAADENPGPDVQAAESDHARRLHAAVRELPRRQQQVILAMIGQGGRGYSTIAGDLGVPVGSLGPTRARALQRLRRDGRLQVGA